MRDLVAAGSGFSVARLYRLIRDQGKSTLTAAVA